MSAIIGKKIKVFGIVQGVGFRPFVYGLAKQLDINGRVRNTSAGVYIEAEGIESTINEFITRLRTKSPPLARIDSIEVENRLPNGFKGFEILKSEPIPGAFIPISPDVSICEDCLEELFDPLDSRYLYPFINCTNCGPRFTIIEDIPYDRPKTTMAQFILCEFCRSQYENPENRRFHAQPVACPSCGPHVSMKEMKQPEIEISGYDGILKTVELLKSGSIVAIKGLGGFHLSCDASNAEAVSELRKRKLRVDKPFALMFANIDIITTHCEINDAEKELVLSKERPIVLLTRKSSSNISLAVAPNQNTLGVMLPYTPLHYLLFGDPKDANRNEKFPSVLVMTSGNLSEEPIAYKNDLAIKQLGNLADAFLLHNRAIHMRTDDSVVRLYSQTTPHHKQFKQTKSATYFIRRSRGYAPDSITLPFETMPTLAVGPELKNTFCMAKNNYAFLSHHIGDMENYETLKSFNDGIEHYEKLFRIKPEIIACDLHPNYLSTRYAQERAKREAKPLFQIQHHHAHIAACMADNSIHSHKAVIGVSFDGTGLGLDGAIWGGEFLIADYCGFQRFAHLEYFSLPGGDSATKKPYRIALSQLWNHGIDWEEDLPPVIDAWGDGLSMLRSMLEKQINSPMTSSVGRLFDSIAALIGIRSVINYEAQAAIELEAIADSNEKGHYPFEIIDSSIREIGNSNPQGAFKISMKPLFQSIYKDLRAGIKVQNISAKFHNGLAKITVETCRLARQIHGINEVALSGGVWQNMLLLNMVTKQLQKDNFVTYVHRQIPPNDGGLSLGQAVIAISNFQK